MCSGLKRAGGRPKGFVIRDQAELGRYRRDLAKRTLREDARVFQGRKSSLGQSAQENFRDQKRAGGSKFQRTQDCP